MDLELAGRSRAERRPYSWAPARGLFREPGAGDLDLEAFPTRCRTVSRDGSSSRWTARTSILSPASARARRGPTPLSPRVDRRCPRSPRRALSRVVISARVRRRVPHPPVGPRDTGVLRATSMRATVRRSAGALVPSTKAEVRAAGGRVIPGSDSATSSSPPCARSSRRHEGRRYAVSVVSMAPWSFALASSRSSCKDRHVNIRITSQEMAAVSQRTFPAGLGRRLNAPATLTRGRA